MVMQAQNTNVMPTLRLMKVCTRWRSGESGSSQNGSTGSRASRATMKISEIRLREASLMTVCAMAST